MKTLPRINPGAGIGPYTLARGTFRLLVAVLLMVVACSDLAAAPIEVSAERHYRFSTVSYVFAEPGLSWQDVASRDLQSAQANRSITLDLSDNELPAWVRVDLSIGDIPTRNWLFDVGSTFGGKLRFYVIENGELVDEQNVNSFESYNTRPYDHRRLKFPLTLQPNTQVQLLLKVEEAANGVFHTHLFSERSFIKDDRKATWLQGMHLGVIVALMLYHFLLAGATRDKNYLYYSIYIASCVLYNLNTAGFGFQYIWPDAPVMGSSASLVVSALPSVFAVIFAVNFLQLNKFANWLSRTYYIAVGILFLSALAYWLGVISSVPFASYLSTALYASFIPACIYSMYKGVVYARFFLIAWTLYIVALINLMLMGAGIFLLMPAYAYFIHQIAFDMQIILLALALAHRIRVLRDEKTEAQADNRAKSAFLARMSHEIRTPLSGVLGMSELLADRLKDKSDIYYNNIIRSSGTSLLTIINDILDYSKFTSGNMELEKIPFSIQRLAVDSLDVFKIKAAEKHIELIADINLDLPTYVEGDPTRVRQVILNFIGNAIKFTQSGQIVLSVDYADDCRDKLRISVSDSGEGISKEEQARLFEAFSQANRTTSRKHGGTGLGLSICKELAHLMDGEIGVESEPGQGSTFWITVYLPASDAVQATAVPDIDLQGSRILIVEDNFTFAELLKTQASLWGMEPFIARNGAEGLEMLRTLHEQDIKIDLISLDLFMPIMDGMELSRTIQLDSRFREIPRILLTSATNFPPKPQLEAAGIDRVVEKPTLPADLIKIYRQVLANEADEVFTELPESARAAKPEIPAIDILVVEDNRVNQTVIKGILKRLNQTPTVVDDGEDAVRLLTREKRHFDLVLMDCEMPRMDGATATAAIRRWEQERGATATPIVALTAHAVQSQMEACYAAGMNAYLTKPIEVGKLEDLLRSYAESRDLEGYAILPLASGSD
ncbi:MAG: response regulator [Cellvibrionaceae bacterium]